MKTIILNCLLASIYLLSCFGAVAQPASAKAYTNGKAYPSTFTITKNEFDNLFLIEINKQVSSRKNKYIDKASVQVNTLTGDMKFLKLKLIYFKNAYLMIQVNGTASTQVFILSDDKSVFYKGIFEKNVSTGSTTNLVMNKCSEDEIVSE